MSGNKSVSRAIEILTLLASEQYRNTGLNMTEIAKVLDIPKASVFDILKTLKAEHCLQENNRNFFIGYKLSELADAYQVENDIINITKDLLINFVDSTKLSASLVLYDNGHLNYILQCHSKMCKITPHFDKSSPYLHASASGKVWLAFMSEAKRKKALTNYKFIQFTEKTIMKLEDLEKEIHKVQENGYARDENEYEEMLNCVACPIFYKNKIVAALSFSAIRITDDIYSIFPKDCLKLAQKISKHLEKSRS